MEITANLDELLTSFVDFAVTDELTLLKLAQSVVCVQRGLTGECGINVASPMNMTTPQGTWMPSGRRHCVAIDEHEYPRTFKM